MKKILIGSILLVTALSVSNANIKQITTIDATTNKNVVSDINSLISSYIDEDSRYTKDTEIFVNEIAKEQLLKNNGFHGNASSLKRSTHYKDNALWMSRSKEDVGVKYSYYGTDNDGNLTYGTSESPLVEPIDIVVAASYEHRETNDKWHNKTIEGMEGYYITLKDIIAKEEHNWEFDNNYYYSTNSEVIEWFKAFTAPCYLGFKDIENKEYIPLDKVSIHTDNNNNLVLSLYSSEATSILTSNNGVFSQALIRNNNNDNFNDENTENNINWSDLDYVAYGDSITYGSEWCNQYKQMETPYPTQVKNILGLNSVNNQAISGATASKHESLYCMSERILRYTGGDAIISVMIGVNDFNRSQPLGKLGDDDLKTIYGALNKTMKHLKQTCQDSYIFYMTPYKENYSGYTHQSKNEANYYLNDVRMAIIETAKIYDIDVLDLYKYGRFEEVMYNSDCDGIHPNQDFVLSHTAPQIAEFIKRNFN